MSKETKADAVRINPMVYDIGATMEAKALELAATADYLMPTINVIAKAKQDYEGGPFMVYFKVREKMTEEQAENLPNPFADSGNNPGLYLIRDTTGKKPVVRERNFYKVFSDGLPGNVAKQQRIDLLELSMKNPVQFNLASVPQEIKDMDKDRREAEVSRLNGELSTSRTNIVAAFEFLFHLRAVNELPGVTATPMYAVNENGELLDGSNGRESIIENTKTPITITTTVEGRKGKDTIQMGIGSFKKLRPAVALEKGGTYQALMDSPVPAAKRGTKGDATATGGPDNVHIHTKETLYTYLLAAHDYLDEITTDSKQTVVASIIQDLNRKSGSDDALVTFIEVRNLLTDILDKVFKANDRYVTIKAKEKEIEAEEKKSAA